MLRRSARLLKARPDRVLMCSRTPEGSHLGGAEAGEANLVLAASRPHLAAEPRPEKRISFLLLVRSWLRGLGSGIW